MCRRAAPIGSTTLLHSKLAVHRAIKPQTEDVYSTALPRNSRRGTCENPSKTAPLRVLGRNAVPDCLMVHGVVEAKTEYVNAARQIDRGGTRIVCASGWGAGPRCDRRRNAGEYSAQLVPTSMPLGSIPRLMSHREIG